MCANVLHIILRIHVFFFVVLLLPLSLFLICTTGQIIFCVWLLKVIMHVNTEIVISVLLIRECLWFYFMPINNTVNDRFLLSGRMSSVGTTIHTTVYFRDCVFYNFFTLARLRFLNILSFLNTVWKFISSHCVINILSTLLFFLPFLVTAAFRSLYYK